MSNIFKMSTESKAKYRALKRKLRFLIYEQECFQEELRRAQRKLLKISRDKSFLLDRLLQYERVEGSSSDSASTASSDSEKETKKSSEAKKQKKKAKPIKVKAKKKKQRQLKSLLAGDRKPLPGTLNYTPSQQLQQHHQQQQHQQQQQQHLTNNVKLMDLMKVGAGNAHVPQNPLVTLGLPMQSQEALFPGVGLPGFPAAQSLHPQQPQSHKLSSLLAGDSSAMGALMRAGLAAAAAGEKAEKQSKKKHKKEADKLPSQLHPAVYPASFPPPASSVQASPSLQPSATGKPSAALKTVTLAGKSSLSPISKASPSGTEATDAKLTGVARSPPVRAPSAKAKTAEDDDGEELVIDLPND